MNRIGPLHFAVILLDARESKKSHLGILKYHEDDRVTTNHITQQECPCTVTAHSAKNYHPLPAPQMQYWH